MIYYLETHIKKSNLKKKKEVFNFIHDLDTKYTATNIIFLVLIEYWGGEGV